jgi:hypothetical protein
MDSYFSYRKAFKARSVKDIRDPNKKASSNMRRNLNRKSKTTITDIPDRAALIAKARVARIINDKKIRAVRINRVLQNRIYEQTLDDDHHTFISYDHYVMDEYYKFELYEYYESMNIDRY